MKVLVICGDIWHPAEVVKRGLAFLDAEDGLEVDYICDAKDMLVPEMLKEYSVIVIAKGNQGSVENHSAWFEPGITETAPSDFLSYIREGGGLLSLHAGNCFTKEDCPEYTNMTGSSFITHPARCEIRCQVSAQHPVTEGVQDFVIRDEHYILEMLTEDRLDILQTSSEEGGVQVGGYVRTIGEGRLCVLAPGHILSTYLKPDMQLLIRNALVWCAGEDA